ncbi:MAG: hypothetical protein GXO88_06355 [Chlorobi bacterium]|nr:hypothetical protein [Chlorobiota bacterium]
MKKLLKIFGLLILITLVSGISINSKTIDYAKQWSRAEKYINEGLPKSALQVVEEIYKTAKSEGNSPQLTKSLLYRISLQSRFQEDRILNSISYFEKEIASAGEPVKQLLQSLTAELYQKYYSENRWKINSRGTLGNYKNDDIATWDAASFAKTSKKLYLRSLENKEFLQNIPLQDYDLILLQKDTSNFMAYPSLYDLLANRAIDYLTADDNFLDIRAFKKFDFSSGLANTADFLKAEYPADSTNNEWLIRGLFKDLIGLHRKNKDTTALIDLELRRLDYYRERSSESSKNDNKMLLSLFDLKNKYPDSGISVKISYRIAAIYKYYGAKYEVDKGEKYRWHLAKALEVCKQAVEKFPGSEYSTQCEQMINTIESQHITIKTHKVVLSGKPILASLGFANINKLYFRLIKTNADSKLKSRNYGSAESIMNLLEKDASQAFSIDLPDSKDYQKHTAEINLPALGAGSYFVFSSPDSTFGRKSIMASLKLTVSELSYILKPVNGQGKAGMYVLNRETGKSIAYVEISIYKRKYNNRGRSYEYVEIDKLHTDKKGFVAINRDKKDDFGSYIFRLQKGNDILFSANYLEFQRSFSPRAVLRTWLFTDRAIYRPGQTVYFKGIINEQKGNNYSLKTNEHTNVQFKDANNKVIEQQDFKTNDYGSFSGEFVIPKGLMNGTFSLQAPAGSARIMVEEYKRPNFKVEFDSVWGQYKIGDSVQITGTIEDYSGSRLGNAEIKYNVTRSSFFPRRQQTNYYHFSYPEARISNGNVKSDADGKFTIEFLAAANEEIAQSRMSYYFNVSVDATDITGETQSGTTNLRLSSSSIYFDVDTDETININNRKGIIVSATNSSGNAVKTKAKVNIYKLRTTETVLLSRDWAKPDLYILGKDKFKKLFPKNIYKDEDLRENREKELVLSREFEVKGKKEIFKDELTRLKPAEYFIEVSADDKNGEPVGAQKYFSVYSPSSSKIADNSILSLKLDKTRARPGEEIIMSLSSADKKTRVFYEIMNADNLVEQKWITISKAQKNIKIPVREEFRGGFSVHATAIKNNRKYSLTENVDVPWKNNDLNIKLETYRDYLSPGAKEEWRISIKDPKGQAAVAEVLAAMYDASLDLFASNNWNIRLDKSKMRNRLWDVSTFGIGDSRFFNRSKQKRFYAFKETYPKIDWFGFEYFNDRVVRFTQGMSVADLKEVSNVQDKDLDSYYSLDEGAPEIKKKALKKKDKPEIEIMPLRTNFPETAFFFPALKTDADGNTLISFKTPDALTEWKIMLLAHDKNLRIGKLTKNIKARKELMIMPNLPRFVRQGDEVNFTAKVVNFTDSDIAANVEIEFFDALGMKPIKISSDELSTNVDIAAKANTKLSWKLLIPDDISMISYRIKATTGSFSDGEERSFPVLTNKMLVTETLPMFINANESKTYNFVSMAKRTTKSPGLKSYRYTVEITSNPIWYAIQALPYLAENDNKSNISAFNRYYSNAISSFIVNSNPQIKKVFESWQTLAPDAFLSRLEKNQELKSAVLQATPWVLEAEGETGQKRRIGILFDLNKLANEKKSTLGKLKSTQLNSGAWSWFNGMGDDVFTTQKIVLGFAKLQNKGIIVINDDPERARMIKKAVSFLDKEIVRDYEGLKKNHPERMTKNNLSPDKIQYLYLRTLLIREFPLKENSMDAFDYFTGQAKKYWLKQNNYLQGMIAIVLNRLTYRNEAEAIMRSLEERSLQNEEMGMYWRQKSGWHWYEAPVETQAMMIEAFTEVQNQSPLINKMKVWLLKQKQTQKWGTPSATVEAVYALLQDEGDLITDNKDVALYVAGQKIVPEEGNGKESGSGYFKTSWNAGEVNSKLADIELQNPSGNIAWGAAYWQYFEDIDKVVSSKSQLSVEKKFFVEEHSGNGKVIEPLAEGAKLKIGQKLISRIIIRSDRDMDFVHLKDMRSSALEPVNSISGYKYSGGLAYYENISDFSTDFFIRHLPKGTYVMEYAVFVSQSGKFSNGTASIQSMYAPEFAAFSGGIRIEAE